MRYGHQSYFVEKVLITLAILWGVATLFKVAHGAELEIVPIQQKTLPNGLTYGLPSGIYFKLTDLHPFIMYKLQYSEDMEKWVEFNRKYSELWPVIITKKDPMPNADEMDGKEGKMELFSEAAGEGG